MGPRTIGAPSNAGRSALVDSAAAPVRRSSSQHVALYIRQLIFDGVLRPGQRVPQDEITKELGVSRIPLRESLIVLEREGWVTIENYRGAFVNAVSAETIEDHYYLLGHVYALALRRAIGRSGEQLASAMEILQADLAHATDRDRLVELIYGFYQKILDLAESPHLRIVIKNISGWFPREFFESAPEAIELERQSIPQVAHAVLANDGDRAVAELQGALQGVCAEVTQLFRERGLFERSEDAGKP